MPGLRSVELIRSNGYGFGFTVVGENPCSIGWVANGSSAELFGLEKHNSIVSVNGENVSFASHEQVVKLIGLSDDHLRLEVQDVTNDEYSSDDDDTPTHLRQTGFQNKKPVIYPRTKHVLNELTNGTLFNVVPHSSDLASFEAERGEQSYFVSGRPDQNSQIESGPDWLRHRHNPDNLLQRRDFSLSVAYNPSSTYLNLNDVLMQFVVAHLGTVKVDFGTPEDTLNECNAAMEVCVYQLRRKQHIHQRVLLKVTRTAVKIYTADGNVIGHFDVQRICFSSSCAEDNRFFYIATINVNENISCHQFMVDPDISSHCDHVEKAKRFGIYCSMDTDTGNCIEFPRSSEVIQKMIEILCSPGQLNQQNIMKSGVDHQIHSGDMTMTDSSNGEKFAGKLPVQHSNASSRHFTQESITPEIRLSKRGKKGNRPGEGSFFRVPKRSSSRQLKSNIKNVLSKSSESIPLSANGQGQLSGASSIESLSSNASLPSYFNGVGAGVLPENGVSSWGISFDKMLEDPMGIKYFTEFLRKEFSQENILFWLECEKLRKMPSEDTAALKELAYNIYERFLSGVATSPVNIDSKGQRLSEEALTKPPHPLMFELQQNQIFKLMKLDSYSRFMKSSLYKECLRCYIEGIPLPLEPEVPKDSPHESHIESRHSFSLKHRRLFPRRSKKAQGNSDTLPRDCTDSESGLEAFSNAYSEDSTIIHRVGVDAASICKLMLWDGSSTVLYAEEGKASIREALNALCERRNVPLSAVDVYYQNEDRALALDQDVSVLAGQEVRVERRTLFRLDLLPIGRSVGVKAKPSKSAEEVLKPVVSKYGLEFVNLQATLSGRQETVDLAQPVKVLDGLRVCVDYISQENSQDTSNHRSRNTWTRGSVQNEETESAFPCERDTEDLINIMSMAQSSKLNDQRGLLSEMNLELPDFLKLSNTAPGKSSQVAGNCNNSNNQDSRMKFLHPTADGTDCNRIVSPQVEGYKSLPNRAGTGNAKARIQKLIGDIPPPSRVTTLAKSKTIRQNDLQDNTTLSAVEDDISVITKWMQSVSCSPKYTYSNHWQNTFEASPPEMTTLVEGTSVEGTGGCISELDVKLSVAHDHRYTKRNGTTDS